MRLTDVVATAVADKRAPAAVLALAYAEQIDEATHTSLGLAKALRTVEAAVATAVDADLALHAGALDAYHKVAAAVSAVTVASDLGPKLLAALDALLLTPKARAAAGRHVLLLHRPHARPSATTSAASKRRCFADSETGPSSSTTSTGPRTRTSAADTRPSV